jgi:ketosteroid isomerase-like protein
VPQRAADDERAALRTALDDWLRATNARNLEVVMNFYPPALETYYLERNVSRASVRADKAQMLAQPGTVLVQRAGEPDIKLSSDGGTATMTFRKPFTLGPNGQQRSGEVLQELRWQKTGQGWKIVGERDIQILH